MRSNIPWWSIVLIAGVVASSAGQGFPLVKIAGGNARVDMCIGKNRGYWQVACYVSLEAGRATLWAGAETGSEGIAGQQPPQLATHKTKKKKGEVVITPAGPMPKGKVHPVRPGETVRRNPDGSYTVVPKKNSKEKNPKQKVKKGKESNNG